MWSCFWGFPHPPFVIAAVHNSLVWDVLICLLLFGLHQAKLFLSWWIKEPGVEHLRIAGMRSLGMGRGDWWRVWITRKNRGALGGQSKDGSVAGKGGWDEAVYLNQELFCAKGCSGGSKGPALPPPPKGSEGFGLHQIPSCQVPLFLVIILCGLIQILHVGNMCVGPLFWFHMIKLWYKVNYNCISNKTWVHMIPFWCVPFSFVNKWGVCVCICLTWILQYCPQYFICLHLIKLIVVPFFMEVKLTFLPVFFRPSSSPWAPMRAPGSPV